MPKHSVHVSDEFWQAVEDYRKASGLKSWSAALVELAAKGLKFKPQKAVKKWGGPRNSEEKAG